jgi:hypothetical protein
VSEFKAFPLSTLSFAHPRVSALSPIQAMPRTGLRIADRAHREEFVRPLLGLESIHDKPVADKERSVVSVP